MKKGKLLTTMLWVSIGCITNMNIAVATSVPTKPVQKKSVDSHAKNKSVRSRKNTEKDITECTQLLNKATQIDRVSQKELLAIASNNTKIAEHLKKPADVQPFSSDVTPSIGKTVNLVAAPAPVVRPIATATKVTAIAPSHPKPITKLPVPPVAQHAVKPIPVSSKVFAADTVATTKTKSTANHAAVAPPKSVATKAAPPPQVQPVSQPHIELFAPNNPNLDHLEGRSASLDKIIQKPVAVDKSATVQPKSNKVVNTTKKPSSTVTNTKAKTPHS